ncbi:hypothetical protein SH661x_002412 [Planctomicrobium sp. SH661]|uniref:hypothetical protein n=1 Tax=Planctomicrobium sp. SH661 TaxID=3448124 RepID=UPI003F5AFEAF
MKSEHRPEPPPSTEMTLDEQISCGIDGELDRDSFSRLEEILTGSADARMAYIEQMLLEVGLTDLLAEGSIVDTVDLLSSTPPTDSQKKLQKRSSRRVWILLSLGCLVVLAGLLVLSAQVLPLRPHPAESSSGSFLAAVTRVYGIDSSLKKDWGVGRKLGAGVWNLPEGTAEIQMINGIKVVLQGPAELILTDVMHARLVRGNAVFNVPQAAIGFVCETQEASVIDLGTEFGISTGDQSGTAVQVYVGEVIANATSNLDTSSRSVRVRSGQAVRIHQGSNAVPRELDFRPNRFVRFLPDPQDKNDPEKLDTGIYNKSRHEELHIPPAPRDIVIDGELNDWDLSGQFESRCEPPFDTYYHMRGAAMFDDKYLYIGAVVGDPFPMRSTVSPHIQQNLYGHGGCLALRVSTDRNMGWPVRGQSINEEDGYRKLLTEDLNDQLCFLVLWYYEPEQLPCLHVKYGMDEHGRRVNPPGYRGAFRKHSDGMGYTVEYAIPWELLHAANDPPRGGDTLGMTWLTHWSGPEGHNWKGQLIDIVNPKAKGWNYNRAATWGRAIYQKKSENSSKVDESAGADH